MKYSLFQTSLGARKGADIANKKSNIMAKTKVAKGAQSGYFELIWPRANL